MLCHWTTSKFHVVQWHMIKYTTFINKKPQMHTTGISLYFTFDIFDTISFIHSDIFYIASSSPLLLGSNSNMHIWKEINRINQIEVNKPNKDCMTEVNALNETNYFVSTIHYVDLKNREECFTTVFFFASPTVLSEALCRPDFNQAITTCASSGLFPALFPPLPLLLWFMPS